MEYKVIRKQPNSKTCLVCGLKNHSGLKASFYELENGKLAGIFQPQEGHQSYPGRVHGGIAAAILDETIGRVIMMQDENCFGVTVNLELKYRKPVPINQKVKVIAWLTRDSSRLFEGCGEILLENGEVAVSAHGKYMKIPMERMIEFDPLEEEWQVMQNGSDPVKIDIT